MRVDFCTFCYSGDAHRLHAPGQLEKQIESNGYPFDMIIVVYQQIVPIEYPNLNGRLRLFPIIRDVDQELMDYGIDLDKPQYQSPTDSHHTWRYHVVNHIVGIQAALANEADYIVFADSDCWMVNNPPPGWVEWGIDVLQQNPDIFIVSPNDGEPERTTQVISQQMFLVNVTDFLKADLNQPGYSGDPRDYPEMPEYHAMLEGRIHHYCKSAGRFRYVMGPEYRYWHFNRLTADGMLETDMSKYV